MPAKEIKYVVLTKRRKRHDTHHAKEEEEEENKSYASPATTAEKVLIMWSGRKKTRINKSNDRYCNKILLIHLVMTLLFVLLFLLKRNAGHNGNSDIASSSFHNIMINNVRQQQHDNNKVQFIKFVTVVLPSVVNPKGRTKRLDAITSTWGPMSHAIYITHPGTDSDYTLPHPPPPSSSSSSSSSSFPFVYHDTSPTITNTTGGITFPQIMPIDATIATEEEGIPRLKYVISQIVKQYNPDFAFFVNDHTFIIPQHLCSFLERHKFHPDQHLYAGHALRPKNQKGLQFAFNSGASGYFLSRKTMKFLMEHLNTDGGSGGGGGGKWLQGNPGLVIAQCLKKILGIDPIDTRDDRKRHVFHAFGLIRVVKKEMDEWYERKHEDLNEILGEDEMYRHELQKGTLCCSPDTVSFHYVEWAETLALWDILMHVMQNKKKMVVEGGDAMTMEELQQLMLEKWPTEKKDIGGYSHHLPPLFKKDVWEDLLRVVIAIAPNQEYEEVC